MTTYTDPFSSGAVRPSDLSYASLALTANVTLVWAADSSSASDTTFARIIDMSSDGGAYSVTFPDARRVSPGYDGFFSNTGGVAITLKNNAGGTIATVAAGEVRYVYLTDNATAAGVWRTFNMGALTSTIEAASLAGAGVAAEGTTLVASRPTTTFSNNYTVVSADRAKNFVWTGGTGTLALLSLSTVDSDFFVSAVNQGTGVLTIDPSGADTIDGAATITLQPTESALLMAGPATEWYSLGRGRSTQFDFALLTKAITGGTTTLTPSEASNIAQVYTGTLISDASIVLPSVVQVYYVSNQTSGAFDVTFQTVGVGTDVVVPQGQNAILLCDGTNVINASTTAAGISSLSLAAGSVSSPSLQFPDTSGFYQPSSSALAAAIAGVQRLLVNASGVTVTGAMTVSNGMTVTGAAVTAATAPSAGGHLTNKTYVDAAIAAASGATTLPRSAKTANYTLAVGDLGKLIDCTTNTFTLNFTAAATLGSGWWCFIQNSGTGDITLDPNGAETVDGLTSFLMYPGEVRLLQCDGTSFYTLVLKAFRRRFDANGTFTKPPGYTSFGGLLWAGGGGGGKGDGTGSGGGGGGGACVPFSLLASDVGTTETVTIAATAAGASVSGAGTAGNNSTFGSLVTAYGGGGGGSVTGGNSAAGGGGGGASGAGGNASGTTAGTAGLPSTASTGANNDGFGGARASGDAAYGGAAGGTGSNTASGGAGGSSHQGGGGGGGSATTTPGAGGASKFGGAGGAGGTVAGNGVDGTRPGGGGGGTMNATGGAGAGGRLDIWGLT